MLDLSLILNYVCKFVEKFTSRLMHSQRKQKLFFLFIENAVLTGVTSSSHWSFLGLNEDRDTVTR